MLEAPENIKSAMVSYFSNDLTQDQADDLLKWLGGNEENRKHFREMEEIWQKSASLSVNQTDASKSLKNIRKKITENGLRPIYPRELRIRFSTFYRAAAAILILVMLGVAFLVFREPASVAITSAFVETSAPKGSKALIKLPDSSIVWLNADTKVRYPVDFGTTNRNVYLEGEAYFKVAKNEMPFRVNTSDITVTALGTAFNVKAYQNEDIIETTLEEGMVRIDPMKIGKNAESGKPVFLKPNQNAVFKKYEKTMAVKGFAKPGKKESPLSNEKVNAAEVKVSTVSDTRLYTSWKDTRWIFKNEKLSNLAPKLERRYDVSIIFEDSALLDYAFSGILKEESFEQVLKAIRYTAPIRYEIDFKKVRLFEDRKLKNEYQKMQEP